MDSYGGHFYAAGMTLKPEKVEEFIIRFEEVVAGSISPEMLVPEIEIDAEMSLSNIKQAFYNIVKQFEPFGPSNLRPVFLSRGVLDYEGNSRIVKEQHIKFVVHQNNGFVVDGIGFGLADKYQFIEKGPFDMVYTIDENEFNGITKLQVRVIDIRPAEKI
jgi:single-stranded-DNA-specific exonuclease